MCTTRFDIGVIDGFSSKKMKKKKNLNGTREPPPHGKCHSKFYFFGNPSLKTRSFEMNIAQVIKQPSLDLFRSMII